MPYAKWGRENSAGVRLPSGFLVFPDPLFLFSIHTHHLRLEKKKLWQPSLGPINHQPFEQAPWYELAHLVTYGLEGLHEPKPFSGSKPSRHPLYICMCMYIRTYLCKYACRWERWKVDICIDLQIMPEEKTSRFVNAHEYILISDGQIQFFTSWKDLRTKVLDPIERESQRETRTQLV